MRLASFQRDHWQLRSGEQSHSENPTSFWIPSLEQRLSLKRGQAVKLIFDIEGADAGGRISVQGERMWVIVSEKVGDTYIGILDNQPVSLERSGDVYLRFGAEVPFRAEHVVDIGQPPPEYIEWQLGQPPDRTWPR